MSLVLAATLAHAQLLQSNSQDAVSSTAPRGHETTSSTASGRGTAAHDFNVGSSTATGTEGRAGRRETLSSSSEPMAARPGRDGNDALHGTGGSNNAASEPFGAAGGGGPGGAAGVQYPSELGYGGTQAGRGQFSDQPSGGGFGNNGYGSAAGGNGTDFNGTAAGPQYSTQLQGGEGRFRR